MQKAYQLSEEMLKQEKSVDGLLEEFIKKLQELAKKNKENVQRHLDMWYKHDNIRAKFEKRELFNQGVGNRREDWADVCRPIPVKGNGEPLSGP